MLSVRRGEQDAIPGAYGHADSVASVLVNAPASDWIAAAGLRAVETDVGEVDMPSDVLANQDLSLMARGLYALLLAQQGQPIDPYEDAYESDEEIAAAIEELIGYGLAIRV